MERHAITVGQQTTGGIRGRATAYSIPNGRPGAVWQINAEGFPEIVEYAASVFEPGCFAAWLANGGASRVRFLFQHGDAGESWSASPFGANALPLGPVNVIDEHSDGLYFDAAFADHELAAAVQSLVTSGALSELSVCSVARAYDVRPGPDGEMYRYISDAELWDISVVVWGQYGLNATVTEVYNLAPRTLAVLKPPTAAPPSDEIADPVLAFLGERDIIADSVSLVGDYRERLAGAAISQANAEPLLSAVSDLRSAASTLSGHADVIEEIVNSETRSDTAAESADANADQAAAARLRVNEQTSRILSL